MNVVLASGNAGKLAELGALLAPLGVELTSQQALGMPEAEETATSFIENALIKARHAAAASGKPAIADDSGIVVPALGGAPGVRSARYAGSPSDAAANNRKLVTALQGIDDRRAYFYCALVFMRAHDDPAPLIATARWHGRIVDAARGSGGFGYDPHFQVDGLNLTAAQLSAPLKNQISHRGKAAAALVGSIRRALDETRDSART
jgi:XTP/dITP diphosphohydrolase